MIDFILGMLFGAAVVAALFYQLVRESNQWSEMWFKRAMRWQQIALDAMSKPNNTEPKDSADWWK